MADAVRVGLDWVVLDARGGEALEECVKPGDGEGDPACTRLRRVRLDEEPGVLLDLPEDLFPNATVWGTPEEPCVSVDASVEICYRDAGEEVGDRVHLRGVIFVRHLRDRAAPQADGDGEGSRRTAAP